MNKISQLYRNMYCKYGFKVNIFIGYIFVISVIILLIFPFSEKGSFLQPLNTFNNVKITACDMGGKNDPKTVIFVDLNKGQKTKLSAMKTSCLDWVGEKGSLQSYGSYVIGFQSAKKIYLIAGDSITKIRWLNILAWIGMVALGLVMFDKLWVNKTGN